MAFSNDPKARRIPLQFAFGIFRLLHNFYDDSILQTSSILKINCSWQGESILTAQALRIQKGHERATSSENTQKHSKKHILTFLPPHSTFKERGMYGITTSPTEEKRKARNPAFLSQTLDDYK